MSGGVLEVHGCAGEWAFAEMAGGMGVVHGDAGHGAGGGYPGSRLGMRGGVVLIHGRVGEEAGVRMRRGLIAITGASGDWLGRGLIAGSILAFGPVGRHPGAGMKRGTLALLTTDAPGDFVGYAPTGGYSFPFMTIYLKQLREWGVPVSPSMFAARFQRYNGDLLEGGRGEILTMGG